MIKPTKERGELDVAGAASSAQNLNRRRMLGLAAGTGIALAGAIAGKSGTAKAHGWLTVEVRADFDTFDALREPAEGDVFPTGPFYVQGPLYPNGTLDEGGVAPEGAESIGTYRCWGWQYDGSAETGNASVNQSFELDNIGEIHVQGRDFNNKAVTGGTEGFRDASGELIFDMINIDLISFRATFTD